MKDKFYQDMTDNQLEKILMEITLKINADRSNDRLKEQLALCVHVMKKRGLLKDSDMSDSLSEKLDSIRHFLEIKEEVAEYNVQHGGFREGAGRPSLGVTKKVSITLPEDVWLKIDQEIEDEDLKSRSAFFRKMISNHFKGGMKI